MFEYYINITPASATPTYKRIAAGFKTLLEKGKPIFFSGIYLNRTTGFSEITGRQTSLIYKGFFQKDDPANSFIASKRYATGSQAKSDVIYFSQEDINPNGSYSAIKCTAVIDVQKLERNGKEVILEGNLILCDDRVNLEFTPS